MSPSKRPEMLVDALAVLARNDIEFSASFIGSPLPRDEAYYEGLKEKVRELKLADRVTFLPGVPNSQTPDLYRAHEIFVNTSPSGMLDKTIFEAAASGCCALSSNQNLSGSIDGRLLFEEESVDDLAYKLSALLVESEEEKRALQAGERRFVVEEHSLVKLGEKLTHVLR
jgi:glycosyltransferase involved in cell wall biosynthesis